jgi:hypothetical protein
MITSIKNALDCGEEIEDICFYPSEYLESCNLPTFFNDFLKNECKIDVTKVPENLFDQIYIRIIHHHEAENTRKTKHELMDEIIYCLSDGEITYWPDNYSNESLRKKFDSFTTQYLL